MDEIKLLGSPTIRMIKCSVKTPDKPTPGEISLKVNLGITGIGIAPDKRKAFLDVTINANDTENSFVSSELNMRCFLNLAQALPFTDEQLNQKDVLQDIIRKLIAKSLDQISFSISALLSHFGLSPLDLSKIINPDNIQITVSTLGKQ
jgi:hypothetical protein